MIYYTHKVQINSKEKKLKRLLIIHRDIWNIFKIIRSDALKRALIGFTDAEDKVIRQGTSIAPCGTLNMIEGIKIYFALRAQAQVKLNQASRPNERHLSYGNEL